MGIWSAGARNAFTRASQVSEDTEAGESGANTLLTMFAHTRAMRAVPASLLALPFLAACASAPLGGPVGPAYTFVPQPGQGRYVRPDYLDPAPTPRIPAVDPCRSLMFAGLVGQNEGAIFIPGLPGRKRIIRPATFEGPDNDFLSGELMSETYVEVQDYLPGQQLYAPSINDITERITLGPEDVSRITIELDREGYVQEIRCG